jgi:hypothetical protein
MVYRQDWEQWRDAQSQLLPASRRLGHEKIKVGRERCRPGMSQGRLSMAGCAFDQAIENGYSVRGREGRGERLTVMERATG